MKNLVNTLENIQTTLFETISHKFLVKKNIANIKPYDKNLSKTVKRLINDNFLDCHRVSYNAPQPALKIVGGKTGTYMYVWKNCITLGNYKFDDKQDWQSIIKQHLEEAVNGTQGDRGRLYIFLNVHDYLEHEKQVSNILKDYKIDKVNKSGMRCWVNCKFENPMDILDFLNRLQEL